MESNKNDRPNSTWNQKSQGVICISEFSSCTSGKQIFKVWNHFKRIHGYSGHLKIATMILKQNLTSYWAFLKFGSLSFKRKLYHLEAYIYKHLSENVMTRIKLYKIPIPLFVMFL